MLHTLHLDIEQMQRVIPGFLLLDTHSTILCAGYEMLQYCPLDIPEQFTDKFKVVSPAECNLNEVVSGTKIILECRSNRQTFQATVEHVAQSDYLLMVCSPQSITEVFENNKIAKTDNIDTHKTQNNLKDQLYNLSAALEHSDIAILTTNTERTIKWANQQCVNLMGASLSELIDADFLELWHNHDNTITNSVRSSIENYSSFEVQLPAKDKKNESKWVSGTVQPLMQNTTIMGCIVVLQDVTHKKQAELQGYKNSKRLHDLVLNLNDAVLLENEKRHIEIVNKRFCELFAIPYNPEMLIGADCTQAAENFKHLFIDEEEFVQRIETILAEKKHVVGEKLQLKDGRCLEREFIPTITDQQYLGHLWIYSDITERIGYQERISKQREFYENVLNQIPSDIAVFDKSHHYLFVNPIGIRSPEIRHWIIGKTDYDYCEYRNKPRSIADDRRELFNAVIQTKRLRVWEEELKKSDGNIEYYLRYMYPVLDSENEVTMVIGYGVNITERKKAEKTIAEALAQQKELYVLKSNFISMISHEFRTPLSTVLSSTQLLKKYSNTLTAEKKEKHLVTIEKAVHRMTSLLENVLFIGKNDSQRLTFSPLKLDVVAFMNEVIEDFVLANAGINRINISYKTSQPTVFADSGLLRQIVLNLLTNAYKYSPNDSEVFVTVYVNEKESVFVIKDQGIGIPASDKKHLFHEFHRASNVGNVQGTGLGLSIVMRCVDAHAGTINVESEVGQGTTFTVTLPQSKSHKI